jgi:hypothetical protein
MRGRYLTQILLGLLFTGCGAFTAGGAEQPVQENDHTGPKCSIQVSSVTVNPTKIHAAQEPNTVTVTVQLSVAGEIPRGAVATIKLLTSHSEPVGNNVRYDDARTLPLKGSPTLFEFKVHGSPDTVNGHLFVLADIQAATAGITVREPSKPSNNETRLETVAP